MIVYEGPHTQNYNGMGIIYTNINLNHRLKTGLKD